MVEKTSEEIRVSLSLIHWSPGPLISWPPLNTYEAGHVQVVDNLSFDCHKHALAIRAQRMQLSAATRCDWTANAPRRKYAHHI